MPATSPTLGWCIYTTVHLEHQGGKPRGLTLRSGRGGRAPDRGARRRPRRGGIYDSERDVDQLVAGLEDILTGNVVKPAPTPCRLEPQLERELQDARQVCVERILPRLPERRRVDLRVVGAVVGMVEQVEDFRNACHLHAAGQGKVF